MNAQLQNIAVPIAIIVGFGLVAAAIYFSGTNGNTAQNTAPTEQPTEAGADTQTAELSNLAPVTEDDYVRGPIDAPIMFVEYSDYDCPFCQRFHDTMKRVVDEYEGEVAWTYRHFPLEQLHPNAGAIAEAAECVGTLGGDDAFWTFSDLIFDRSPNESTDMSKLDEYAATAGVDVAEFTACRATDAPYEAVAADFANARAVGAGGTPYTVVVANGEYALIDGAQPYEGVVAAIEQIRSGN